MAFALIYQEFAPLAPPRQKPLDNVMAFPLLAETPVSLNSLLTAVAKQRDRAAFAQLFDHFAPRLKSYMQKLGSSAPQAEELVQETMLLVWRRAETFDATKANASTWIYTIARNKRIDVLRRERRPEPDPTDPAFVSGEEGIETPAENADTERELSAAIATLPPEQAELLRLAYYEDKAHSEIAAEKKLPLGTVKSRLRLALEKLRRILRETDTGKTI